MAAALWASSSAQAGLCTGVVISQDRILTAAHCFESGKISLHRKRGWTAYDLRAHQPNANPAVVRINAGKDSADVLFMDGTVAAAARILKQGHSDLGPDLALLSAPTGARAPVILAKKNEVPLPSMCLFVGFPGPQDVRNSVVLPCFLDGSGVMQSPTQPLLRLIGEALPGDSGGPVLSASNTLIGITVRTRFDDGVRFLYATPFWEIEKFLAGGTQ